MPQLLIVDWLISTAFAHHKLNGAAMPPSKLTIKEKKMSDKAIPINSTKRLLPDFLLSFGIASIIMFIVALWFRELPEVQIVLVPAMGIVVYLNTQKTFTGIKYGAEHRFICTLLVKATIKEWPLRNTLYKCIKRLYANLGEYTTYDDLAGFCYAIQFYEEKSNLNKYGSMKKRVDLLKPFFSKGTPWNTLYKRFKKFELEGSALMPGM